MENKDQSELVEKYLFNRLTKEDEAQFKASISKDKELLAEVDFQKKVVSIYNDKEFNTIYSAIKDQPLFPNFEYDDSSIPNGYDLITIINNSSRFFKKYLTN